MKNILGIKKISSILLVGTIMIGSSAMTVRAAYKRSPGMTICEYSRRENYVTPESELEGHKYKALPCLVVNGEEGINEILVDYYENSDDDFESKLSSEDRGRYFYNGEEIEGSTRIGDVHENGDNMLVSYKGNPDKPADEIWKETERSRSQMRISKKLVDLDSREEEELGEDDVYRRERIYEYPYPKKEKYQVTFINGQKVDEDKYFEDYENVNGDNSAIVYISNNPSTLPQ